MLTDQELERAYPRANFRQPLQVTNVTRGQVRLFCLSCLTRRGGLMGHEVAELGFRTRKQWEEHISWLHPSLKNGRS